MPGEPRAARHEFSTQKILDEFERLKADVLQKVQSAENEKLRNESKNEKNLVELFQKFQTEYQNFALLFQRQRNEMMQDIDAKFEKFADQKALHISVDSQPLRADSDDRR